MDLKKLMKIEENQHKVENDAVSDYNRVSDSALTYVDSNTTDNIAKRFMEALNSGQRGINFRITITPSKVLNFTLEFVNHKVLLTDTQNKKEYTIDSNVKSYSGTNFIVVSRELQKILDKLYQKKDKEGKVSDSIVEDSYIKDAMNDCDALYALQLTNDAGQTFEQFADNTLGDISGVDFDEMNLLGKYIDTFDTNDKRIIAANSLLKCFDQTERDGVAVSILDNSNLSAEYKDGEFIKSLE